MKNGITHVAIDDSARKLSVAVLTPSASEPTVTTVDNERGAVRKLARKLLRQSEGRVQACYEAGPLGFELWRWLEEDGIPCQVAAPSLTPRRSGQRVKTDVRDARKLVRLFRAGELSWVRTPTEDEEAARDLVRCLAVTRRDVSRAWNRVGKFLLRHGRRWEKRGRTQAHGTWLRGQKFEHPVLQMALEQYRYGVEQAETRLESVERAVRALSQTDAYRERVAWLTSLRGVSVTIAMIILTELHGIERFHGPRQMAAFIGLVPSEYSTGERRRQGAITKTGSPHVRWALVQMAHSLRHEPGRSKVLAQRRKDVPAWVAAIAERAERRGHDRYRRMMARGKETGKVIVALSREQVGFIWSLLTHATRQVA